MFENDITFEQLKSFAKCCKRTKIFNDHIQYKRFEKTHIIYNDNREVIEDENGSYEYQTSFLDFASHWFADDDNIYLHGTIQDWDNFKSLMKELDLINEFYKLRKDTHGMLT